MVGGSLFHRQEKLPGKLAALVHAALETAHGRVGVPGSALLVTQGQRMPLTLEVAPLRPTNSAFGEERSAALVFIGDPEALLAVDRLRELFGLTRTEATVAAALGSGQSLDEIDVQMGIGLVGRCARIPSEFFPRLAHIGARKPRPCWLVALRLRGLIKTEGCW